MAMTADPRVARLRSLDTEATPGPWHPEVDDDGGWDVYDSDAVLVAVVYGNTRPDAALVAAMRNAWPAMVTLVELVLADRLAYAALHNAALAVLDTLDLP
jgi:hypothetical protein